MVASPAKGTITISSLPELPDSVSPDFREITLKERYSHSADFGDTSRTIPSFCSSLSCRFTATPFCFKILKAHLAATETGLAVISPHQFLHAFAQSRS